MNECNECIVILSTAILWWRPQTEVRNRDYSMDRNREATAGLTNMLREATPGREVIEVNELQIFLTCS
jgi:hypothetical protein